MKPQFFLFLLLVLTNSVNIRKGYDTEGSPLEKLRKIKELSEFASSLIANVELHLQTGGKVDEVINLVKEAHISAQTNRNDLKREQLTEVSRLNTEIDGYTTEVASLNQNLITTSHKLEQLGQDIAGLETTIAKIQSDINGLTERGNTLNAARENDIAAFAKRQSRDDSTVRALEEIIPRLQALIARGGSSFIEKSKHEIKEALKKLPKGSIQAFVALSTQFSEAKLKDVIVKLSQILDSVKESRTLDRNNEIKSKVKFQALVSEVERLKEYKFTQLQETRSNKQQKEQERDASTSLRNNLVVNIDTTGKIRDQTIAIRDSTDQSYNTRIQSAQAAVDALAAALQILTENQGTLQQQETQSNSNTGLF